MDANDPVFASSAINLLFGIEKIAIARQVRNDFGDIVSGISTIGGNLLLKGERFLVKVEGTSKGFLTSDVELAATSEIIEKKAALGAKPGTAQNHDKLLYTYLTRRNAYVCIFSDRGMSGAPFRSDSNDIVCCIYDELSAISCFEAMKQGFNPEIIICYRRSTELTNLARIINRILPRLQKDSVTLSIFRAKSCPSSMAGYGRLVRTALELSIGIAEKGGIAHVSVPVSYVMFQAGFVDELIRSVAEKEMVPVLPLAGLDSVFADARELGMASRIPGISRLLAQNVRGVAGMTEKELGTVLESVQNVSIKVGPNNVHDFLDSMQENH